MLEYLKVSDLGVIVEAEVSFAPGLVAITGETGAGKTLVTTAIDLLLGGKVAPDSVRHEAGSAKIQGVLRTPEGDVALIREIARSGRGRALVNGEVVSSSQLRRYLGEVVEIFGQQLSVSLQKPSFQLQMLDRAGGVDTTALTLARREYGELSARVSEARDSRESMGREVDYMRRDAAEIDQASPTTAEEEDDLVAEIEALSQGEEIREALYNASSFLSREGSGGAVEQVALASGLIRSFEMTRSLADRLASAQAEVEDIREEVVSIYRRLDSDPNRLDAAQERLSKLTALKRKFGRSLAEILAYRQEISRRLAGSEMSDFDLEHLEAVTAEALLAVQEQEDITRRARGVAAKFLEAAVGEHLKELALEKARIEIVVGAQGDGSPVEFLFSANPGLPPLPLSRVASGGELSRLMLALSLVVGAKAATLIFDEVDAGVGGETALKVGRALQQLARDRQVIVVTHLAQVAAFADQHLVVSKSQESETTRTTVVELEASENRIREVARMLSGHQDSQVALDHAAELLTLARRVNT